MNLIFRSFCFVLFFVFISYSSFAQKLNAKEALPDWVIQMNSPNPDLGKLDLDCSFVLLNLVMLP